jgi:8-amino-7-oxononanoate synthase
LRNAARAYVFSTAPPAANAAAALAALKIVRHESWRRCQLLDRAASLRQQLRQAGWNIGESESQIIPIIVGAPQQAVELSAALRRHGLFVPAIRPPSIPPGSSRLRISLHCLHSAGVSEALLAALNENRTAIGLN